MAKKEDIDKIVEVLDDALKVVEDVKKAKEDDDKISLLEGGMIVVQHGGKAVRFVSVLPELADEFVDIDGEETSEIAQKLIDYFGASDEAQDAILDITEGAGLINAGVQKLIDLKKAKEAEEAKPE